MHVHFYAFFSELFCFFSITCTKSFFLHAILSLCMHGFHTYKCVYVCILCAYPYFLRAQFFTCTIFSMNALIFLKNKTSWEVLLHVCFFVCFFVVVRMQSSIA